MERTFNRCMGLWGDGQTLWMTSLFQLWRFENVLEPGQTHDGFDRLFVPRVGYTTGDLDIHDLAVDGQGRVVFVNTLFSCLATVSDRYSFEPLWRPPFITRLAAEDRCHLNGLALRDGQPRYVTAVSASDAPEGWREHRRAGGIVIECPSGTVLAEGLSMPHSPRWYRGQLWLLEAGTGFFGRLNVNRGVFEPLTFCAGFLRGLSFVGEYAVVATSRPRDNRTFADLPLDANLAARRAEARCQIAVIDLRSCDVVHTLQFEGVVGELYDVVVLPQTRRPSALGFKTLEICRTLSVGEGMPL
jgi:uncharacterized protein (TIGR03032 family)